MMPVRTQQLAPRLMSIPMQLQRWTRRPRQSTLASSPDCAAARTRAIAWATAAIADERTVFLDTETTGFPPSAEIVDVAIVAADGRVLLDTLVRPAGQIPPGASAIHGIMDADVRDAPNWAELMPLLRDCLDDRLVVVYNADFDRKVLEACCARSFVAAPLARWECAMRAYAEFRGDLNARTGQFRWHKLEQAALHCGFAPGGHRALADAEVCRQVVAWMARG